MPTRGLPSTESKLSPSRPGSALPDPSSLLPFLCQTIPTVLDTGLQIKSLRNLFALVMFMFVVVHPATGQSVAAKVAEYMNAQVEVNRFRGAVLVAKGGKVLVTKSYGTANGAPDRTLGGTERYHLGSISKQFTAAAILQLQEQGKLQTQDSVCGYLPNCPAEWQKIKIFDLLVQTDGIPEVDGPFERGTAQSADAPPDLLARLGDRPLEFKPGQRVKYGGSGYAVLEAVVERISGEQYSGYLKNHIFTRLNMEDTGYDDAPPVDHGHVAAHSQESPGTEPAPDDRAVAYPYFNGRLYSTVADLSRWDRELYGGKVISKRSVDEMFKPYFDGNGFGWAIRREFDLVVDMQLAGLRVISSSYRRYADANSCVIVLSNEDFVDAEKISHDLAAILFGQHYELPVRRHRVTLDPAIYDSYVGRYELAPDSALIVTREGSRLMIQGIGPSAVEIQPESTTRFFATGLGSEINFVTGDDAKTVELILQQGGRDIPVIKVKQ
jgi:CubicO group peptidase (beta-lactamase class C family)